MEFFKYKMIVNCGNYEIANVAMNQAADDEDISYEMFQALYRDWFRLYAAG